MISKKRHKLKVTATCAGDASVEHTGFIAEIVQNINKFIQETITNK